MGRREDRWVHPGLAVTKAHSAHLFELRKGAPAYR